MITLRAPAVVVGRVLDEDGNAVSGAQIDVESQWLVGAVSGAEGAFRIEGSKPGPGTISARHREHLEVRREVVLHAGEQTLDFVLSAAESILSGTVVNADDEPLGGVEVGLWHLESGRSRTYDAVTAPDGTFRIERMAVGTYDVRALSREGIVRLETKVVVVEEGSQSVVLRVVAGED